MYTEEQINAWLRYMSTYLVLKHGFEVVDRLENNLHGWGKPDKEVHDVCFYKYRFNRTLISLEEFTSPERNVKGFMDRGQFYWGYSEHSFNYWKDRL